MAKESTIHRQMIQAVVKGREDGIVSSERKERSRRKVKRRVNCIKVKHDMGKSMSGGPLRN